MNLFKVRSFFLSLCLGIRCICQFCEHIYRVKIKLLFENWVQFTFSFVFVQTIDGSVTHPSTKKHKQIVNQNLQWLFFGKIFHKNEISSKIPAGILFKTDHFNNNIIIFNSNNSGYHTAVHCRLKTYADAENIHTLNSDILNV